MWFSIIVSKKVDTYINSNKGKRRAIPAFFLCVLTFLPKSAIMYIKDFGG